MSIKPRFLTTLMATAITVAAAAATTQAQTPTPTRVLSINNSLIYYNGQNNMFDNIAKSMGTDATWTTHTNLGKPLAYHYTETDDTKTNSEGQRSARNMVAGTAWTHIILQEKTTTPLTEYNAFDTSISQWVSYIRMSCPNTNASIVLPLNWALHDNMSTFKTNNATLLANYRRVAQAYSVSVCPVGLAYELCYEQDGADEVATWFTDDRHPTVKATYLAACMEYATIFGIDPTTIAWHPTSIDAATANTMRQYAKKAIDTYKDSETANNDNDNTPFVQLVPGTTTQDFDTIGTKSKAQLPTGWRIDCPTSAPRTVGTFAEAYENTMYAGGDNLPEKAKNGTWNLGDADNADRALGGITTGTAGGARCINVYWHLKNTSSAGINGLSLAYDVEKYRNGSTDKGFDVQLYTSADGTNWTSAGKNFMTHFDADADNAGYSVVPAATINVSGKLNVDVKAGGHLYLAWNISVAKGTKCSNAQVLGIDNISLTSTSTGIDGISRGNNDTHADAPTYSIGGQRVPANARGLVLRKGRKTVQP